MQYPEISIIIPAYQEEKRIGPTLEALSSYLDNHYPGTEVIVVCDGCMDNTAKRAQASFQSAKCVLRVLELTENSGKGYAVKNGVQAAHGKYIIFTDADLSFSPNTMEEFVPRLKAGVDVVIAQRNKTITYPSLGRRLLATCSRFLVGNFLLPGIRDSQAGYKAFAKEKADVLFSKMRTHRFLFDLEILLIARRKNYIIEKVYVDWQDRPGSTVRIVVDSLRCWRDLLIIYFLFLTRQYD